MDRNWIFGDKQHIDSEKRERGKNDARAKDGGLREGENPPASNLAAQQDDSRRQEGNSRHKNVRT